MTEGGVRVWDPFVRLCHWSLVATFAVTWMTGEEDSLLHVYSGYVVIGLVLLRIFWGFVGTRHARFSDFLYSPRHTIRYLQGLLRGRPEHYIGHNPAGGWMIVMLLISLLITGYTGLEVYGAEGHGPLAAGGQDTFLLPTAYADDDRYEHSGSQEYEDEHGGEDDEAEEFWEDIHEFFANLTLLLVLVHIAGVVVAGRLHGENLVRAMITGRKPVAGGK